MINALGEKGQLSTKDIMELLNCNRQSVNNYIHRLQERGIQVSISKQGKKAFYSLSQKTYEANEAFGYEPITFNTLRKYCIIQELQENPTTPSALRNKFVLNGDCNASIDKLPLDIAQTHYYNLLRELIHNEKEIVQNKRDKKFYLTGKNIPLIKKLSYESSMEIFDKLITLSPGTAYFEQLQSIFQKIAHLSDYTSEESDNNNFLVYGHKAVEFQNISHHLNELEKYDYEKNILKIKYIDQYSKEQIIQFALGLIIFNLEKDKVYLIGKIMETNHNDDCEQYIIIDANTITSIDNTSRKHTLFQSTEFLSIYNEMFSISIAPPTDIKINFDCTDGVKSEVEYLNSQRKTSNISCDEKNNTLTYSDRIRGLEDFLHYLRQFGESARIQEPNELKEKMLFSIKRSLKRYEEEIDE